MSAYLGFQGTQGNHVYAFPSEGLLDVSSHPELEDIKFQPYNYRLLEDGVTLQYTPDRQPHWTYHLVEGRWVPNQELLAQLRATKWAEIKAYRDDVRNNGGFPVGPYWFHSDAPSKIDQLGLTSATMMGALPVGKKWKLMDGSKVTLTPTLVQQIFGSAMARRSANFDTAEEHRVLMEASYDPASYDFTTGWPPIYGE